MNAAEVGLGLIGGPAAKAFKAAWQPVQLKQYFVTTANMLTEMEFLIYSLLGYHDAIAARDADSLHSLLRDDRITKEQIDVTIYELSQLMGKVID
ncbi:MAG: hypothetical protein GX664_01735 [Bacteroidales bacterium]|nr:hypothetical protein [Bacteroidales bacterium]